ncbi:hypothetical protein [Ureibacillus aquaedulcis]|uniref:Uncharacterized protein n=1 Tax=Ureibacillus aquaedulcis TaxID=3058421 RepID=A0ABT8GSG2_9BACL|nr:hypothetical protein [Ureibacillus sp. BA0131]MDN4494347.1 hypothetical protein [Ureibacillus sp. BA0131]
MIKRFLTICMVILLPQIAVFLLKVFLFKEAIDWEYIYLMSVLVGVSAMIIISVHDKRNRVKESKFNYTAKVRSGPIIFLLGIFVVNTTVTVNGLEAEGWVIRIAVLAAITVLTSLRYKFYIEDSTLTYEILLFTIMVYKRGLYPDEVKQVRFIRFGWSKKVPL